MTKPDRRDRAAAIECPLLHLLADLVEELADADFRTVLGLMHQVERWRELDNSQRAIVALVVDEDRETVALSMMAASRQYTTCATGTVPWLTSCAACPGRGSGAKMAVYQVVRYVVTAPAMSSTM